MSVNFVWIILLLVAALGPAALAEVRRFLHVSDFHLDPLYAEGSNVKDFCHGVNNTGIYGSDAAQSVRAGRFGNFKCDSPQILVKSAIKYMKKILPDPDFILWTGDSSPHYKEGPGWDQVYSNLRFITKHMYNEFGDNVKIIPVLGNHDSSPKDTYNDFTVDSQAAKSQYKKYIVDGAFGSLLSGPEAAQFKQCGYYVIRDKKMYENVTQTFIVLNTNLYYHNPANVSETDPCNQLKWLDKQLRDTKAHENVFITAHVPPGFFELYTKTGMFQSDDITKAYLRIVGKKRNARKIVAHFYGHLHASTFRLFFDPDDPSGAPVGVGFIASSVTPLMYAGGVNPSIRIYDYDPQSRKIITYKQYYLPLEDVLDDVAVEAAGEALSTSTESQTLVDRAYDNDPDDLDAPVGISGDEFLNKDPASGSGRRNNGKFLNMGKREVETTTVEAETTPTEAQLEAETTTEDMNQTDTTFQTPAATESANNQTLDTTTTAAVPETTQEAESTTEAADGTADASPEDVAVNRLVVRYWRLAFDARDDWRISDLSVRQMYKAYRDMRSDPEGEVFLMHRRDVTVLNPVGECDRLCHAKMVCSITNYVNQTMNACIHDAVPTEAPAVVVTTSEVPPVPNSADLPDAVTAVPTFSPEISDGGSNSKVLGNSDHGTTAKVVGVIVALLVIALVGVVSFWYYRRIRMNRYRSQEFLLTDSVFKYDGYSQLDHP